MMGVMKRAHASFWAAFWQGVSAPTFAFAPPRLPIIHSPVVHRNDLDAMRGDWVRVGGDIRHVIAREKAAFGRTA